MKRMIWIVGVMVMLLGMTAEARSPYSLGYGEGCRTARKGVVIKRRYMFRHNANYRRGWRDGRRECSNGMGSAKWNSYRRGYRNGCASARGTWRKNRAAYRYYSAYRRGWKAGWRNCR